MAVLEVKELTKKYGEGESEVIALDHVSFSVERGEFVAIIGAVSYTHLDVYKRQQEYSSDTILQTRQPRWK